MSPILVTLTSRSDSNFERLNINLKENKRDGVHPNPTVSNTGFERTKEKFDGFRQTVNSDRLETGQGTCQFLIFGSCSILLWFNSLQAAQARQENECNYFLNKALIYSEIRKANIPFGITSSKKL